MQKARKKLAKFDHANKFAKEEIRIFSALCLGSNKHTNLRARGFDCARVWIFCVRYLDLFVAYVICDQRLITFYMFFYLSLLFDMEISYILPRIWYVLQQPASPVCVWYVYCAVHPFPGIPFDIRLLRAFRNSKRIHTLYVIRWKSNSPNFKLDENSE